MLKCRTNCLFENFKILKYFENIDKIEKFDTIKVEKVKKKWKIA